MRQMKGRREIKKIGIEVQNKIQLRVDICETKTVQGRLSAFTARGLTDFSRGHLHFLG